MAIHAGLGWRNAGKARNFDRRVTVAAIDPESGDVMLMTERNRLRLAHALIRDVRRALHDVGNTSQCGNDENCAKDSGARQRVRAAMKDLRHSLMRSGSRRPGGALLTRPLLACDIYSEKRKPPTGFRSRWRNYEL